MSTELAVTKRKSLWLQFSLCFMLAIATVLAIFIWWLIDGREAVAKRKEATKTIRQSATVVVVYDNEPARSAWRRVLLDDDLETNVIELDLYRAHNEFQLASIFNLTKLKRLRLREASISGPGLTPIANLKQLEELCIAGVTDHDLLEIGRLTKLKHLDLLESQDLSDIGMVHLSKLTNLEVLKPGQSQVSDIGLVHLAKLTNLRELWLNNMMLTDSGMVDLSKLTNLEVLKLGRTKVSDAGLVNLAKLTNLKELWLNNTKVTDSGMVHLTKLTKLKKLATYNTVVTSKGEELLKNALPQLEFVDRPPF